MNNLMMPASGLEASNARDVSERSTALSAVIHLPHTTTAELITDADIILTWLRSGRALIVSPTPEEPQNPA